MNDAYADNRDEYRFAIVTSARSKTHSGMPFVKVEKSTLCFRNSHSKCNGYVGTGRLPSTTGRTRSKNRKKCECDCHK